MTSESKKPSNWEEQRKSPLQPALKRKAMEKVVKAYNPETSLDQIDFEAHVTRFERFNECLYSLQQEYPGLRMTPRYDEDLADAMDERAKEKVEQWQESNEVIE